MVVGSFHLIKLFSSYCKSEGIVQKFSCPYMAAQNGVVERKHRHISEAGLSLLTYSQLPYHLWTDFTLLYMLLTDCQLP